MRDVENPDGLTKRAVGKVLQNINDKYGKNGKNPYNDEGAYDIIHQILDKLPTDSPALTADTLPPFQEGEEGLAGRAARSRRGRRSRGRRSSRKRSR